MKAFSAGEFLVNVFESASLNLYKPKTPHSSDKYYIDQLEEKYRESGLLNKDFFDETQGFSRIEKLFISHRLAFTPDFHSLICAYQSQEKVSANIDRLIWLEKCIDREKLDIKDNDLREKLERIYAKSCDYRKKNKSLNPVELIVLAEGATEEILLPVFAETAGLDFLKNGVKIISSGGKNQVLKLYKKLSREVNLPIFLIFDSDASREVEFIKNNLREIDDVYVNPGGEFEDILSDKLICRAVNNHYRLTGTIKANDISNVEKKSSALTQLWKEKGFGEFKKVEFARILAKNISKKSDISKELQEIISRIKTMLC